MQASQVDGNYGDTTKAAVTKFQERNGLAQDGVVGVATWNKLQDPNAARKQ
jgi:peptidoglycan hydrolase-like protein with peptidoglycan-binding domain